MLKFDQWLDKVDPYAIQRIALYKCLFIATVEVYVYWLYKPVSFLCFFSPFFLVALYEAPVLSSFKKKEQLLIFITIAIILISVSFYLIYPFKVVFFFFSLLVLALTYFSVLKYFYALKNLTMLLIATGAIVLSVEPPASIQVAFGFISSTLLAMASAFICLKLFPNQYLIVWNRALQKFIECLQKEINSSLDKNHMSTPTEQEILHLDMIRNYRRMVPKKYMMQTYRISVNIRNIQFSLDNIYYETENEVFWYGVKSNLNELRLKMKTYTSCGVPKMPIEPQTKLQHYVVHCLHQAFIHWNKLCSLRQH